MSARSRGILAATGAFAVACVLAVVDRGGAPGGRVAAAAPAWAAAVEAGEDHLEPEAFVARLLDDPASLLVIDVRPADEFAAFHLRDAVNLDVPALLGPAGDAVLRTAAGRLVVLVSGGMVHPGQVWVELARRGRTDVKVLEGGLDGLRERFLTPVSLRSPASAARVAAEAGTTRRLRERFAGGTGGAR
jgi:rhodanese-related sulfurtransferase